jgi:hypothetical protein
MGDIMSESMGGIISECPGDFIGIGSQWRIIDFKEGAAISTPPVLPARYNAPSSGPYQEFEAASNRDH